MSWKVGKKLRGDQRKPGTAKGTGKRNTVRQELGDGGLGT